MYLCRKFSNQKKLMNKILQGFNTTTTLCHSEERSDEESLSIELVADQKRDSSLRSE